MDVEIYRAMKEESKKRRKNNRDYAVAELARLRIPFESKNSGAHLIVMKHIDYWPGTGKWVDRDTGKGKRGIKSLWAHIFNQDKKQYPAESE